MEQLEAGQDGVLILDRTPFYAESGGQTGDTGEIGVLAEGEAEVTFAVADTQKGGDGQYLHMGTLELGTLRVGDTVTANIDEKRRRATMRNHTAAHLLQAALRTVLGDHVHQAGQLVNADRCRFDFSHFSGMTAEELQKTEDLINAEIMKALPVMTQEMPIDEAKKLGAMALFGEKYGDVVRVVTAGDQSVEFCGGTHVHNTAEIGLCRILSESSVAAGVRRIELVTGENVLKLLHENENILRETARILKVTNPSELPEKATAIVTETRKLLRDIDALAQQVANSKMDDIFKDAPEINGIKVVSAMLTDVKPDMLRSIGDQIRSEEENVIALLAGVSGDTGNFYCVCSKSAVAKGAHAGRIIQRIAPITGGKGGGRPDSAMGGIGKTYMVDEALGMLQSIAGEFLNA